MMSSGIKALNAEIKNSCFICKEPDRRLGIEICRKKDNVPKHWAHKKCQREWAKVRKTAGAPEDQITCAFNGVCQTRLKELLHEKTRLEQAVDFFKTRPAVQILSFGVPLLAINAMFGSIASEVSSAALLLSTAAFKNEDVAAIAIEVAVETAAGAMLGSALQLNGVGGVFLQTIAGIAVGITTENLVKAATAPWFQRRTITTGAAIAGIVGASLLVNGCGFIAAGTFSAFSLASTYWEFRRM